MDREDELYYFEDENGTEYPFTLVLTFSLGERTYYALLPADLDPEDEDYGLLVMRLEGEHLLDIPDEEEAEAVYEEAVAILDGEE